MHYVTTALGRVVPPDQVRMAFQDLVLKVLFDYGTSPFNATNVPWKLSSLATSLRAEAKDVQAVADSLVEAQPPLLERLVLEGEPAYRVTGNGIVFVENLPQRAAGAV